MASGSALIFGPLLAIGEAEFTRGASRLIIFRSAPAVRCAIPSNRTSYCFLRIVSWFLPIGQKSPPIKISILSSIPIPLLSFELDSCQDKDQESRHQHIFFPDNDTQVAHHRCKSYRTYHIIKKTSFDNK